jgi:hypothetical protein
MKRNLYVGAIFLALLGALAVASVVLQKQAAVEAANVTAPKFEVDPFWPKPLPNHWIGPNHRRIRRCARSRLDHPSRRFTRTG